eukprot:TRINITY_DN8853_c0_g1::TRINITY_DN8853_c0_g1_i1::g.19033::m.19033 TRINITY_DN8853_c0_g1::TRINITY_DN8853_c0_g1_i1::g.19033  ORF type:complete len:384 (+),score=39.34,sp/Q54QU5/WDR89_DICDI/27.18/3e-32,WD40/PF00400.27/1.3,WD40/PF00400.27/8.3e+02,WD40/PF00400.27/1.1e+02,WD40/PF00400.27/0.0022,WD40/PF00400.27/0.0012 TRINITY_DN8853_c0_g1_i1:82-1233(+)
MEALLPPYTLRSPAITQLQKREVYNPKDFDDPDGLNYVIQTALVPSSNAIAAASTDNQVKLYNFTPTGLKQCQFSGRCEGTINDLWVHNSHPHLIFAASSGLYTSAWDLRTGNLALNFKHGEEVWTASLQSEGVTLATGTDHEICLWDLRTQRTISHIDYVHTEPVTRLRWHPVQTSLLLSGSVDGLATLFNPSVADEDDALSIVLNVQQPVSQLGFFGDNAEYVWATSTVESLALFRLADSARLGSFPAAREAISGCPFPVDYLVSCHYSPVSKRLFMLVGSNSGEAAVVHVSGTALDTVKTLSGGHNAPIRCCSYASSAGSDPSDPGLILTGGEDARLCEWRVATDTTVHATPSHMPSTLAHSTRREKAEATSSGRRFQPY